MIMELDYGLGKWMAAWPKAIDRKKYTVGLDHCPVRNRSLGLSSQANVGTPIPGNCPIFQVSFR
jgi:hypothetical protein